MLSARGTPLGAAMPQELEITIPTSMRLSKDIGSIGQYVAQKKGHSSVKDAIEAIVRAHWKEYLAKGLEVTEPTPAPSPQPPPINALQALDSVL